VNDREAKRRADRDARESVDLADALARAWRTKFGAIAVVAEPPLAEIRRGGR